MAVYIFIFYIRVFQLDINQPVNIIMNENFFTRQKLWWLIEFDIPFVVYSWVTSFAI